MKPPYDSDMTRIAQELRRESTPEENTLWYQFLRRYPVQFKRQKPFGRYVLDFYCSRVRLAVELDGAQHFTEDGRTYDANRTAYLNVLGITVLRFTNRDVRDRLAAVCRAIDEAVMQRL